jgi:peptidoglycan/LPS O-acetylase OafA/YrhL
MNKPTLAIAAMASTSGRTDAQDQSKLGLTLPRYRADIDGLRAIAVFCVIGFHAFPAWIRGGFVGVDIFFVISGYLISTMILENLHCRTFSFLEFYVRRIKRIFPALLVVLIASLVFGWFALLPHQYNLLAKHVAAGAGFVSNFLLWHESGYFDAAATSKPLLHLWSLGVEEQFYLFWPPLLWLCWKLRFNLFHIMLAVGAISFALNVWEISIDRVAAFYSPQTRIWEFSIGSCLAYFALYGHGVPSRRNVQILELQSFFGVSLIAVGILFLNKDSSFPGWWALFPTIGTALVISAGQHHAWLNRVVLSNRGLVWIGLISFPLYLWHWPLLSFPTIMESEFPSRRMRIVAILASILLAWLTYMLVEKPVRFGRASNRSSKIAFASMALVGVSALALTTLTPSVFSVPSVRAELLSKLSKVSAMSHDHTSGKMYGDKPCFRSKQTQTVDLFIINKCVDIKLPGRPTVFLMGDSHSASLSLGLRPLLDAHEINLLQVGSGWCMPTTFDEKNTTCQNINSLVLNKVAEIKPDVLIIDCYWIAAALPNYFLGGGDYMSALLDKLQDLKARGAKSIIVVGQIPIWPTLLPDFLAKHYVERNLPIPTRTFDGISPESLALDSRMKSLAYPKGITYLSMKDTLCNESGCLTAVGPDLGRDLVVWDDGHLTVSASRFVTQTLLEPVLSKMLEF